jgi:cytochrome c
MKTRNKTAMVGVSFFFCATFAHAHVVIADCGRCHSHYGKLAGPSYHDIAKKYGGQKDAAANLAKSIKAGSSGKWGRSPMPAQAALSDADALTLATWILAGAK